MPESAAAASPSSGVPVAVVHNPTKATRDDLEPYIAPAAAAAGHRVVRWYETSEDDPGQGCTQQALADGALLVLVAGGDGTVRAVAESIADTDAKLALIPSGTGNLLARNIAVPHQNTADAVHVAFHGHPRPIDIGQVRLHRADGESEEHGFLVMVGLGIDAEVMASTNANLKRAVGWLAYVEAGMRALPKARPFRTRYALDGGATHSAHVMTILVGNSGTLPGGIILLPDAALDDGRLDIAVLQPRGFFGWLKIWSKVRWENSILKRSALGRAIIPGERGRRGNAITYLRSATVDLRVDEPRMIEIDGDEFGDVVRAEYSVRRHALTVMVESLPELGATMAIATVRD